MPKHLNKVKLDITDALISLSLSSDSDDKGKLQWGSQVYRVSVK